MTTPESSANKLPGKEAPLPKAVWWMYGFQTANGVNFTIALGTPMILIGKFLGGKEMLIGFILSLTPFLNVLQMLASNTAERWGYKRMVLSGWSARSFVMLLAVPLPLLHGRTISGWAVPDSVLLGALVMLLFLFNFIRGITCIGWVPWVSQIVPEEQRGRYFGWDQTAINAGVFGILVVAGLFLGDTPTGVPGWKYAVLLGIAWLAGWLSVQFLKPVPCNMPSSSAAKAKRDWRELAGAYRTVWAYKPFRRFVRFHGLNNLVAGAYAGFTIVFMRDELKVGEGYVLGISAVGTVGLLLTSIFWGRFADRFGSRSTMRLAGLAQLVVLTIWILTAAGIIQLSLGHIFLLSLVFGVITAAMTVPLMKLYMASFPQEEMTVAVTLNTVISSLCAGIAPLFWGGALNLLGSVEALQHGWLRPFTIFFGVSALLTVFMQVALSRVQDSEGMPTWKLVSTLMIEWPRQLFCTLGETLSGPRAPR